MGSAFTFEPGDEPPARSRLRWSSRVLILLTSLVALAPIPVTILQLLPSYRAHAQFLVFFTPLVCLLTLAYLVYIRESLGRLMLADVLDPLPRRYPSYRENLRDATIRKLRRLRRGLLLLLPALLLATSLFCGVRYVHRLNDSVSAATQILARQVAAGDVEVGFVAPGRTDTSHAKQAQTHPAPGAPLRAGSSGAAGQFVLNNAAIDVIPLFGELTALYIGVFASAAIALAWMALREYTKDALGLSDTQLVLRKPEP